MQTTPTYAIPIVDTAMSFPVHMWTISREMFAKFAFQWLRSWSSSVPDAVAVYGSGSAVRTICVVMKCTMSTSRPYCRFMVLTISEIRELTPKVLPYLA